MELIIVQYINGESVNIKSFDEIVNYEMVISISCNHCKLTKLPEIKLPNIISLNCSSNQIKEIPSGLIMPKLRKLWCYNNNLSSLPADISDRYPELELLDCGNNQLIAIPDMMNFAYLHILNIDNNKIHVLPNTINCPNIKHFSCKSNKIANLSKTILNWKKLKFIDLTGNIGIRQNISPDIAAYIIQHNIEYKF